MVTTSRLVIPKSLDLSYDRLSFRARHPKLGVYRYHVDGCCRGCGGDCEVLKKMTLLSIADGRVQ
jgi:hypothetical protein